MGSETGVRRSKQRSQPAADTAPATGAILRAFALEQLQQAQKYLASKGEDRHTGVHEARKCLRRIRATLALGAKVFDKAKARSIDEELGRLCRGLSHLRDAQALIEALQRLRDTGPAAARLILPQAEVPALRRREQILQRALLRDPGFAARRHRLAGLQKRLGKLDWHALGQKDIARALKQGQRRVDKARRRAKRHPDDAAAWHLYRRRLRRLRQQDTLLSPFHIKPLAKMQSKDQLATALGESQDDVLLLHHCGKRSPFSPAHRAVLAQLARARIESRRRDS